MDIKSVWVCTFVAGIVETSEAFWIKLSNWKKFWLYFYGITVRNVLCVCVSFKLDREKAWFIKVNYMMVLNLHECTKSCYHSVSIAEEWAKVGEGKMRERRKERKLNIKYYYLQPETKEENQSATYRQSTTEKATDKKDCQTW